MARYIVIMFFGAVPCVCVALIFTFGTMCHFWLIYALLLGHSSLFGVTSPGSMVTPPNCPVPSLLADLPSCRLGRVQTHLFFRFWKICVSFLLLLFFALFPRRFIDFCWEFFWIRNFSLLVLMFSLETKFCRFSAIFGFLDQQIAHF